MGLTPFFSVVIPVYNRAGVLGAALQSVLAQNEQDFEIIVVDDGSRDDPKAVIAAQNDSRIVYLRQDNRGGGAARNAGIDAARGTFVALLDSDDVFLPGHLAAMRALLSGTVRTVGYAQTVVDRGEGCTFLKPPRAIAPGEDMATYLLCDRGFVPTITTVLPAALARQIRYDESLPEAEDTDFAIRLAQAGCRFVMAKAPGAVWTDHYDPNRLSAGRSSARMERWLETMKPALPERAYFGARGWAVAKGVARTDSWRALQFFLAALFHNCYRPALAVIVFLQIFLPDRLYRALADGAVAWLRAGIRVPERIQTEVRPAGSQVLTPK